MCKLPRAGSRCCSIEWDVHFKKDGSLSQGQVQTFTIQESKSTKTALLYD